MVAKRWVRAARLGYSACLHVRLYQADCSCGCAEQTSCALTARFTSSEASCCRMRGDVYLLLPPLLSSSDVTARTGPEATQPRSLRSIHGQHSKDSRGGWPSEAAL